MNPAFRKPCSVQINEVQIRSSSLRLGVRIHEFIQKVQTPLILQQEILIPTDQDCIPSKKRSYNHGRNATKSADVPFGS